MNLEWFDGFSPCVVVIPMVWAGHCQVNSASTAGLETILATRRPLLRGVIQDEKRASIRMRMVRRQQAEGRA